MIAHRPANQFASEQVEDHGQIEPALASRDVEPAPAKAGVISASQT
jgi:hypothetical protein